MKVRVTYKIDAEPVEYIEDVEVSGVDNIVDAMKRIMNSLSIPGSTASRLIVRIQRLESMRNIV